MQEDHRKQIETRARFEFGENWARFLRVLDDERIQEAKKSLQAMLGVESLVGKTFLDVGSGSGLFSLAARSLGAKVTSFDFDPKSVSCAYELKRRYFHDDPYWLIHEGSVLDKEFLSTLGQYDIVYSWGVLHHTGQMWQALENVMPSLAAKGQLFIAIYNDQERISDRWARLKQLYCSGFMGRQIVKAICIPYFILPAFALDLFKLRNPFRIYSDYKKQRGMSKVHDWYDWLGGYPFEVAKPEEIFAFYRKHDFELRRLITCGGGLGCNQFVFVKP